MNQGIASTHRPSIAQYEELTRPGTSSLFSRNYRKTQLLRKLENKSRNVIKQPLMQIFEQNPMICMATQTQLHESKEKRLQLMEKGRTLKRKQVSCQTEEFPNMNNMVFVRPPKMFRSFRQLFERQETQVGSARFRLNSNHLPKKQINKTQPSVSIKGSVERFELQKTDADLDLVEYLRRSSRLQAKQFLI